MCRAHVFSPSQYSKQPSPPPLDLQILNPMPTASFPDIPHDQDGVITDSLENGLAMASPLGPFLIHGSVLEQDPDANCSGRLGLAFG
jgi:hypothetical protein